VGFLGLLDVREEVGELKVLLRLCTSLGRRRFKTAGSPLERISPNGAAPSILGTARQPRR